MKRKIKITNGEIKYKCNEEVAVSTSTNGVAA